MLNSDDSRAYFLRAEHIRQLTRDHTLMDNYVRKGHLTPKQATRHPDRHVLTRALGLEPVLQSDLVPTDVLIGDVLLLSSDRLTQMLPDQHLEEIAHSRRDIPSSRAKP